MIGIEFETEFVVPAKIENIGVWKKTHDASIETPVSKSLGDGIFVKDVNRGETISGVEFVSPVFRSKDEALENLKYLIDFLADNGEPEKSFRSGIHIHIGVPEFDRDFIINIVKLSLLSERILYYIGGFGYKNRAILNDFTYCRPYSNPPIVTRNGDSFFYLFTIENLISARTLDGIWSRVGVFNINRRYVPIRYMNVNFYSLINHGTIEFRVFNKTYNLRFLSAAIDFCDKFVQAAQNKEIESCEHSIFEPHNNQTLLNEFDYLNDKYFEIGGDSYKILKFLLKIAKVEVPVKYPILTHLRSYDLNYGRYFVPKFVPYNEVKRPSYVDVHNLSNGRW